MHGRGRGEIWDASEQYVLEQAKQIRNLADEREGARLLYFGLAEIPHVIALGAYLGDERHVEVFDYHRDEDSWRWPQTERTIRVKSNALSDCVSMSGPAVVRVSISAAISEKEVDEVIGTDRIADIEITVDEETPETATTVQSAADVKEIRQAFRSALATLAEKRPNAESIHLFVAAPTSVCFVLGQELHLRNNVPVQTYRYRTRSDGPNYRSAIELTAEEAQASEVRLTDEDVSEARRVRAEVWPEALKQVKQYARAKEKSEADREGPWHQTLSIRDEARAPNPFPALPPVWTVVDYEDTVDPEPYPGNEYGRDEDNHRWRLSDPLLVSLSDAVEDDEELKKLVRLFLFHEYVHRHHSLTKYNAEGVGRFANCLERLDYMADLYAVLHELDWCFIHDQEAVAGKEVDFLARQLDLLLRSAWSFIPGETVDRWQVRRVRRLLNWYWRRVQVQQAETMDVALRVLARPPSVELVGQQLRTGRGRTYMMMTELDPTTELSLGLVTEDERLLRIVNQVNYNLEEFMEAFRHRKHQDIRTFFNGAFEEARQMGGALPDVES